MHDDGIIHIVLKVFRKVLRVVTVTRRGRTQSTDPPETTVKAYRWRRA